MNEFASNNKFNTVFIVKNIMIDRPKTIRIFNNPIPVGKERDLLAIRGISESDIRASLLKGEILHKLLSGEISVISSDIDLIQFNPAQAAFLQSAGIMSGLKLGKQNLLYSLVMDRELNGLSNGTNVNYKVPDLYFIINQNYGIIVYRNGIRMVWSIDYTISESGGVGTGYDTVTFSIAPFSGDYISADYYIPN